MRGTTAWLVVAVLLAPGLAARPAGADAFSAAAGVLPTPRTGTSAVWTGTHAYVFGGYDGSASFDRIVRYDPATGAVQTMGARLPTSLTETAAVWTGQHALVFGGRDGSTGYPRQVLRYDPATDTVARLPDLPFNGFGAAWSGTHAYSFGNYVQRYDPATGQTVVSAVCCTGGTPVWVGEVAYVFGYNTNAIKRYDPRTDQLVEMAARLPHPVNEAVAVHDGRHVFVATGYHPSNGQPIREVVRYDPAADAVVVMSARLPAPGFHGASGVWTGRDLLLFGGLQPGSAYRDAILRYSPAPAAPAAFTGTPGPGPGEAALGWQPPAADTYSQLTGYRVYRGTAPGQLAPLVDLAAVTSFVDRAPGAAAEYHYQVAGLSPSGEGARSPEVAVRLDRAPVARVAPVEPAECVAGRGPATLDGTASADPEGAALTYQWSAPGATFDAPAAARTTGSFPLGTTAATLTVGDGRFTGSASTPVAVVDSVPPATTAAVQGLAGNAGWWRSAVTVALAAEDACGGATTTRWSLDGAPFTPGASLQAGEGVHALRFHSRDAAGNEEPLRHLDLRVDTVPPATAARATGLAGDGGWFRSAVDVALLASDATSGVAATRFRVGAQPWAQGPSLTLAGDGVHGLEFHSEDVAGNAEAPRGLEVRIDATPPATSATLAGTAGQQGWFRSAVTATLVATDATSGVASTWWSLDGGPFVPGTTVEVAEEGVHALRFHSRDLAGNEEPVQEVAVKVDRTPPQVALTQPAGGSAWVLGLPAAPGGTLPATLLAGPVPVAADASDALSGVAGVALLLDGAPRGHDAAAPYAFAWDAGREAAGFHALAVQATDLAGNAAVASLDVVTVPTSAAGLQATECRPLASDAICDALPAPPPPPAPPGVPLPPAPGLPPGALEGLCRAVLPRPACDTLARLAG